MKECGVNAGLDENQCSRRGSIDTRIQPVHFPTRTEAHEELRPT